MKIFKLHVSGCYCLLHYGLNTYFEYFKYDSENKTINLKNIDGTLVGTLEKKHHKRFAKIMNSIIKEK